MFLQVPGGNNGQPAADGQREEPAPEGLAPANAHAAGNHGDEAELDDEEEDEDGDEDEEDDDEEGREEDVADANNGGQGLVQRNVGAFTLFLFSCQCYFTKQDKIFQHNMNHFFSK